MGYYTWKSSEKHRKSIGYGGGYFAVVLPDNSRIETDYYNGYGSFGCHDLYEVVVDQNRDYLGKVWDRILKSDRHFGLSLTPVVQAYIEGGDSLAQSTAETLCNEGKLSEYLRYEWKRNIGIAIACEDKDNRALPYPLKVIGNKECKLTYDELLPALCTQ